MEKLRAKELRTKGLKEIRTILKDLKKQLMKFNNQIKTGTPPEKPGEVKKTKKSIARILTILREKEIEKNKNKNKAKTETKNKQVKEEKPKKKSTNNEDKKKKQ